MHSIKIMWRADDGALSDPQVLFDQDGRLTASKVVLLTYECTDMRTLVRYCTWFQGQTPAPDLHHLAADYSLALYLGDGDRRDYIIDQALPFLRDPSARVEKHIRASMWTLAMSVMDDFESLKRARLFNALRLEIEPGDSCVMAGGFTASIDRFLRMNFLAQEEPGNGELASYLARNRPCDFHDHARVCYTHRQHRTVPPALLQCQTGETVAKSGLGLHVSDTQAFGFAEIEDEVALDFYPEHGGEDADSDKAMDGDEATDADGITASFPAFVV